MIGLGSPVSSTMRYSRRSGKASYHPQLVSQQGVCRKAELAPVDVGVDTSGEAGVVPVDARGDTAAGASVTTTVHAGSCERSRGSENSRRARQAEILSRVVDPRAA